jgi:phenylacetate-CoA ligase
MSVSVRRGLLRLHQFGTGRHILDRLDELNRTQWLSHDELLALQATKLQRLVEYAYQYVPYYRRTFDQIGFEPRDLKRRPDYLGKLPILTKAIIRANYRDMLTTEPHRRRQLSELCTSGSTGEPLVFMQDHDFRDAVTADVQRHMGWAGCEFGDWQALIWCAPAKPTAHWKIRTWLIDWLWARFRLNAYGMTPAASRAFVVRVQRQKPIVLFGFATDLYQFAQIIKQGAYPAITFHGIFSTAEIMAPHMRQYIEATFKCKVFSRYGTFELGGVACECPQHTGLHVSVENNYVEIVQTDQPAAPDEVGDLIVTNLNNLGMPFIRYAIGDAAAWQAGSACPCGRAAPRLKSLEGRIRDAFKTRDGRTIYTGFSGHAFHCLAHPSIRQFQIIQKTLDRFVVRLVAECDVPQSTLDDITTTFRSTFGENVTVDFEFMDKIPPLPSGKHQYAVSEVNRS